MRKPAPAATRKPAPFTKYELIRNSTPTSHAISMDNLASFIGMHAKHNILYIARGSIRIAVLLDGVCGDSCLETGSTDTAVHAMIHLAALVWRTRNLPTDADAKALISKLTHWSFEGCGSPLNNEDQWTGTRSQARDRFIRSFLQGALSRLSFLASVERPLSTSGSGRSCRSGVHLYHTCTPSIEARRGSRRDTECS